MWWRVGARRPTASPWPATATSFPAAPGRPHPSTPATAWRSSRRQRVVDARAPDGPRAEPSGLRIAGQELPSRLVLGTGGIQSLDVLDAVLEASGTALSTVAVRR